MPAPVAQNWNHYWSLDQTQRSFTKISWSKRRILRVIQPYILPGHKALDAGCGSGFFSQYFCEQGMVATALDYSDEALRIAKEKTKGRATLFQGDLCSPEIVNQINDRYDVIFTDGLFEHFTADQQDVIMQNFKRLLSENGVIITFVPNRWSPWELIRPFFMPGIEEAPFVFNGLLDLNERNGLSVLNSGGVNTVPLACSPDRFLGRSFGMLLYTIAESGK